MCIILLFIFAILIPTLVFMYVYSRDADDVLHTCNILRNYRIPCGPPIATSQECTEINCCFNEKTKNCYHTLPSKYQYKSTDENWKDGFTPLLSKSPYKVGNTERVYLNYENDAESVALSLDDKPFRSRNIFIDSDKYNIDITTTEMGIEIHRKNKNKDLILTTTHGPTIISDKYWEWTLNLNTNNLFGLDQFRFKDNETVTRVVYPNDNNHGVIPKFMAETNGVFHGAYIEHSGPLEITVLPSKLIILKMLSGERVNIHLSLGPSPSDIWRQQGIEHVLPPYWALGVHICRYE